MTAAIADAPVGTRWVRADTLDRASRAANHRQLSALSRTIGEINMRSQAQRGPSGAQFPALETLNQVQTIGTLRQRLLSDAPELSRGLERIAILGAGVEGLRLAKTCIDQGIALAGVYDTNAGRRGERFAGLTVYPSEAITKLPRNVPIIVASHRTLGACETLRALGYGVFPFAYLQVAWPDRFAPHPFYDRFLEDLIENRQEYLSLFDAFADETSRQVLDAVLMYRLTLDPLRLRDIIDWDLYGSIQLGENEVYVDGGSFNGDSIQMFIDHVHQRFSKIYAFEPDSSTFKTLHERFGRTANVVLRNAGLFSRSGTLAFSGDSSRAARIDERGEVKIDVVRIDDVVQDPATFIKMNIEGAELDALDGARRTIAKSKPKLAISAYHRASDLRNLCRLIRELNSDYRLLLRQHDGGTIETVIYAC